MSARRIHKWKTPVRLGITRCSREGKTSRAERMKAQEKKEEGADDKVQCAGCIIAGRGDDDPVLRRAARESRGIRELSFVAAALLQPHPFNIASNTVYMHAHTPALDRAYTRAPRAQAKNPFSTRSPLLLLRIEIFARSCLYRFSFSFIFLHRENVRVCRFNKLQLSLKFQSAITISFNWIIFLCQFLICKKARPTSLA